MKSKFPYCDQIDCKHYETCQDKKAIVIRLLQQNEQSINLHNRCRDMVQNQWENYLYDLLKEAN